MGRFEVLQKLDSIRDEFLDILEMFKEQHEALLWTSFKQFRFGHSRSLERTRQAFYESKSYVNTMMKNGRNGRTPLKKFFCVAQRGAIFLLGASKAGVP